MERRTEYSGRLRGTRYLVRHGDKKKRYLWGPRLLAQMDPERQSYKVVKSAVTTVQLAAEGGATLVVAALRRSLGDRPIQEAARLFRQLMGLRDMRRQPGESMRKWTSRFEAFIKKTGKALHQADAEIDEATYLHPLIQRILLLECSNLSPAENAAVLATSGATSKEGGSIGNSYLYVDLAASFIAQWDGVAPFFSNLCLQGWVLLLFMYMRARETCLRAIATLLCQGLAQVFLCLRPQYQLRFVLRS